MSRELLQQALDALESLQGGCTDSDDGTVEAITVWCPELIDALRSALAAPQPEPVAWKCAKCGNTSDCEGVTVGDNWCNSCAVCGEMKPLYATAPPAAPDIVNPITPAGMVTVPREPTQEMIAAGEAAFRSYCFRHVNGAIPTYEAMIAAVPAPAAPDLKHKPTVQRLMDLARKFRATPGDLYDGAYKELQQACYEALSAAPAVPIDMVLHCPKCGVQHIDAPETDAAYQKHLSLGGFDDQWHNPPHRSHLCRPEDGGCGHIWRPADVPTNGVAAVQTKGKADSPIAAPAVPLTDEQIDHLWDSHGGMPTERRPLEYNDLRLFARAVLSAAPVVREPLTDAQIDKIFDDAHENMPKGELFRTFVTRAIERAHGIGGGGK